MRVLQAKTKRPLDLLAVGGGGRVAAACSLFGVPAEVDVWESGAASGRTIALPGGGGILTALAFHAGTGRLFVGNREAITAVDVGTGTAAPGPRVELPCTTFALSGDGSRIAVSEDDQGGTSITCWEVSPGLAFRELWGEENHLMRAALAFGPCGEWLALVVRDAFGDRPSQVIQVRESDTGSVRFEVPHDPADPVQQLAFSADGSKLLARSSGRTVKVFDAATGQPAGELVHPGRPYVTGMAVHPNGQVACSRNNGTVCLWDLGKRELVRTLDWKLGKLVSVAFAPDGSIGAAGTEDGQVVVWDVDS